MAVCLVYLVIFLNYFVRRIDSFNLDHIGLKTQPEPTTIMYEQNKGLHSLPVGNFSVTTLNCGYNNIEELSPYVFYFNLYKNLEKVELQHNQIKKISFDSFRELKNLKSVDLSANNLTHLDPVMFKNNIKLEKVDFSSNQLVLDPEKPFIKSFSIETLVLSENNISVVFDITFAKLPQLRNLMLDNNFLIYLSQRCFAHLKHLQYISLANTNVLNLSGTMFKSVPHIVDLSNTPLSKKFDPPLEKVRNKGVYNLIHVDEYYKDYNTDFNSSSPTDY